ncbi:MAG TPA: 50S ribosomal protein L32 [Candidatus Saccharimonas sp.]|nr:50S ribosomal protein L32 [Candidatus Saccharimonas sp.]
MPGSAVPKKRTTSGAQGRRRSHLALSATQLQPNGLPRRLAKAAALGLVKSTKKA